ncbi:MAG: CRISPR-associated endonuclease Cas1 [Deltaproteobacteria bacterium]|nr:CRISPR-associated endonuclease Cas1 [Deltaproteobacteria bacterium]
MMNAEYRHDKKKNPADFSMLILRLEKQIIDQKDPSKISRILKDERIWKALNAQQQVKWSNLAQMAGEVETACRVLMHINQFSPHTEEAWQNHLLLLSVLDNKKELARILALSRKYVDEKLYNQWVKSLRTAAVRLRAMEINVLNPGNIDVLRGMEGAAARVYYSAFRNLIRNESFTFNGRNRRPPLDPVNAMLSFIYTLLTNNKIIRTRSLYG